MIIGTRRTRSDAAAGGAMRNANTSRFPTAWNDDTIEIANNARSAAWASPGRSPSIEASDTSNVITRNARYSTTTPTRAMSAAMP